MSVNQSLRTEWTRPSWMLTIDPVHKIIALEGGFSRSDCYACFTLEEFLQNIDFQKEIAGDFGMSVLEEVLMAVRHLLVNR
ncbi:MAG: hypothetical protein K8U57_26090 [Planctomycetes bacterium]|nr:hypothetical protein [Planctomycetota bacterium]